MHQLQSVFCCRELLIMKLDNFVVYRSLFPCSSVLEELTKSLQQLHLTLEGSDYCRDLKDDDAKDRGLDLRQSALNSLERLCQSQLRQHSLITSVCVSRKEVRWNKQIICMNKAAFGNRLNA